MTRTAQKMKVANLRSDEVQKQSDNQLFDSIARGTRHKEYPHAFKYRGLSDSQIRKLVAYIRELPKTTKINADQSVLLRVSLPPSWGFNIPR